MAKGIRVNQLAKELGVESKRILDKLREEGLSDQAPNHMSTLSLGLAESVREWFSGQGAVSTAVETAAPVETKKRSARTKARKEDSTDDSDSSSVAVAEAPVVRPSIPKAPHRHGPMEAPEHGTDVIAEAPAALEVPRAEHIETIRHEAPIETHDEATAAAAKAPHKHPPKTAHKEPRHKPHAESAAHDVVAPEAPVTSEAPVIVEDAPAVAPIAPVESPIAAPTAPAAPLAPAAGVAAPTAPGTGTRPAAPHGRGAHAGGGDRPSLRPTVNLSTKHLTPAPPVKPTAPPPPAVTPAPQLQSLEPAKIQGPRIVRIEKEEVVDPRGPRRPGGGTGAPSTPGFTPALPRGGRGVKISEEDEEEARKKAAAKKTSLSTRRRGPDGRRGEADEKLREFTEADLIARRDALNAASATRKAFDNHMIKVQSRGTHAQAKTTVQKGEPITVEEPITIKSLSAALGIKGSDLQKKLAFGMGMRNVTPNSTLEVETAATLALEYGLELRIAHRQTMEEQFVAEVIAREPDPAHLIPRPPVVTILGHVDHGKTSLLDKIRNANVAAGEAGGITQHTAAWQVVLGEGENAKRVTFIDTPGHQAFTSMRARGANMTDVVVLVVSAAEGVQPQTIESINHARAAGVPIVVAMNKIDRPDANPDMILGQLAKEGLNPIEWGGDTEVVRTSATTGQGITDLLEILDLQSQILELKTDPTAPARGAVIESAINTGLGDVSTVLVQDGTLHVGDVVLCGPGYGRIRSLINDRGEHIQQATAGTPVIISGLSQIPSAGAHFYALDDFDRARAIAEERAMLERHHQLAGATRITADNLFSSMKASDIQTINLIVKGDVQGSVETLTKTVTDSNTDEVRVKVIHSGVGAINESDVELAMATKAGGGRVAVIGFHVVPDESARSLAEQNQVEIKLYRVIYEIFDDLKKALSGMLTPEVREKLHGHVEVRMVIKVSKVGNVAGCFVTDGHIQRGSKIRLIRDGTIITEDLTIESLRRVKDDVKEVKSGFECGIKLSGYDDIKVGDVMEAYIREEFERTL